MNNVTGIFGFRQTGKTRELLESYFEIYNSKIYSEELKKEVLVRDTNRLVIITCFGRVNESFEKCANDFIVNNVSVKEEIERLDIKFHNVYNNVGSKEMLLQTIESNLKQGQDCIFFIDDGDYVNFDLTDAQSVIRLYPNVEIANSCDIIMTLPKGF